VRSKEAHPARTAWLVVAGLVAFMLLLAGCGSSSSHNDNGKELQKLGKGEGQVNLISPQAFVEPEWTPAFERKTGCKIKSTGAGTFKEIAQLMSSGEYDGVVAPGNDSARLVADGYVAPVNVSLVPNYKTIFSELKNQPYNTFEGVHYGIPQSRNANVLIWNPKSVKPAPTSWDVMFDPKKAAKYKGKISVYNGPIYIADAAVYLKAHQPNLGIENPYELNEEQFEAAVNLLQEQRPYVGEYWVQWFTQNAGFTDGASHIGDALQFQYQTLRAEKKPVATSPASQGFLPVEGATGWSESWMISSTAKHPNCMYKWIDTAISPHVNAIGTEIYGAAPAQSLACSRYYINEYCVKYHAKDPAFWKHVYYWETPEADCGNGSSDCMDYNDWVKAWASIKAGGPS
jgi:putative spermidine/putrescine transport system substrate-binding protein